jgi:hypothetical protein
MARKGSSRAYTPARDHSSPPPMPAKKTKGSMQAETDQHLSRAGIGKRRASQQSDSARATSRGGGKSSGSAKSSSDPRYSL